MRTRCSLALATILALVCPTLLSAQDPAATQNRLFEWTFHTDKVYADPFNDVDVDVIFARGGETWRVPTFWSGGNKWTVRFAPPAPGEYTYQLESTDRSNPDLNGHRGTVTITAYTGPSALLRHGSVRVSANKRYFEFADGTPFYWLGDTWWTGLSSRLSWDDFQKLTADRKAKGFTAVQIVAGLIPSNEEEAPSDPGFCDEGGCVWTPNFERINPAFFDYADRRIQYLVDNGIVPVIVGGWRQVLKQMGLVKMKKHWRYIIARYGAFPVLWLAGGEVYDQRSDEAQAGASKERSELEKRLAVPGWTEVVRYIRDDDPYHHPLSLHEVPPPLDTAINDESLTDFDLFQPGHSGWPSIAAEVALLNKHYARTTVTKPLVVGEIVYEELGGSQLADAQRAAFWLGMLNGAAGFTYGNISTAEAYTTDKPLHRLRWSLMTWDEAMKLPGSHQVGIAANLLKNYPWWRFAPHPEWVTPRGTTLLEPNDKVNGFDIDLIGARGANVPEDQLPLGEWQRKKGTIRLPYAAGIPGEVRIIYLPYFGFGGSRLTPTVLGLEKGKRYHAFYWEPSTGTRFDLGAVEIPEAGATIFADDLDGKSATVWSDSSVRLSSTTGGSTEKDAVVSIAKGVNATDLVASVELPVTTAGGLVLRFKDPENFIAAIYSPVDKSMRLIDRRDAKDGTPLAVTALPDLDGKVTLTAELRGTTAALSATDGNHHVTSAIVDVSNLSPGGAGVLREAGSSASGLTQLRLRQSPQIIPDELLNRELRDADGRYRGEWSGPGIPELAAFGYSGMNDWGKHKHILLDAYRPERPPFFQDWVLVLKAKE